jgi:hypothetical protein
MTFFNTDGKIGIDVTATPDTSDQTLGTRTNGIDGNEYVYVQASGAITQYDAVGIDENYQAAALTKAIADDGWMIGFAQVALADNDYGWVATRGSNIKCRLAAACAVDVTLYTTGTAGVLDDTSTSQTNIDGVVSVGTTTSAAQNGEVIATWPRSATF